MNNYYMEMALKEAKKAYKLGDIPVGAIIVDKDGTILSKAYNKKNKLKDPTCHAEILAIRKACKKVKDFRLEGASMYVTLEPCIMCYGALLSARLSKVYFGAYDKKFSISDIDKHVKFNHSIKLLGGIMEEECGELLSDFFSNLRSEKNVDRNSQTKTN